MENYLNLMTNIDLCESINVEKIIKVENEMGIKLPLSYKSFIQKYNGGEGEIGKNSYLVLWSIDEIIELNKEYGVSDFTPGLVYFGSDGGSMAYAFDFRPEKPIFVEFPTDSIHIEDANYISDTFGEFIEQLHNR